MSSQGLAAPGAKANQHARGKEITLITPSTSFALYSARRYLHAPRIRSSGATQGRHHARLVFITLQNMSIFPFPPHTCWFRFPRPTPSRAGRPDVKLANKAARRSNNRSVIRCLVMDKGGIRDDLWWSFANASIAPDVSPAKEANASKVRHLVYYHKIKT